MQTVVKQQSSLMPGNVSRPTPPAITRKWLRISIELLFVAALTVLLLEFTFALAGIGEGEYLRPDAITGVEGIANKAVTYRKEGYGRFLYNSFGMQDYARILAKPLGTTRIAFLGDSYVEALQVDRKHNFCNLIEKKLNERFSEHFEVLNFGVSSSNLGQLYLRLKHRVLAFHPDFVILPIRVDAAFQLAPNPHGGMLYARPTFFADTSTGRLIQDNTIQNLWQHSAEGKRMRMTGWLREHSRIWGVIALGTEQLAAWWQQIITGQSRWGADITHKNTAFGQLAQSPENQVEGTEKESVATDRKVSTAGQIAGTHDAQSPSAGTPATAKQNEQENYDRATRYLWPVADALIKNMSTDSTEHGCRLVLVRLPGAKSSKNDIETELLHQTAMKYRIPLLDASETFRRASRQSQKLFYDTHLTPSGHELMAQTISNYFCQNLAKTLH